MKIEFIPVKSAMLSGIGMKDGVLMARFAKGDAIYSYPGLPEAEAKFEALKAANADPDQSVGGAFRALVTSTGVKGVKQTEEVPAE